MPTCRASRPKGTPTPVVAISHAPTWLAAWSGACHAAGGLHTRLLSPPPPPPPPPLQWPDGTRGLEYAGLRPSRAAAGDWRCGSVGRRRGGRARGWVGWRQARQGRLVWFHTARVWRRARRQWPQRRRSLTGAGCVLIAPSAVSP